MLQQKRMIRSRAPSAQVRPARRPRLRSIARVVLAVLAALACAGGLLAYFDPAIVPAAVDEARALFGPRPVALVESLVFQAQDAVRQARYQAVGTTRHVQWAAPAPRQPDRQVGSVRPAAPLATESQIAGGAAASPQMTAVWSTFVSTADGRPALERALVSPDPTRPYVETALVRIDLRVARLHLVAGTQEPLSSARVARPGVIPIADRQPGRLLAAFNGGFKAANGDFGMAVNGVSLLPPIDGMATLAIYRDGRVALGTWGADISATHDPVAFRQNCPLLLDGGVPTEAASTDAPTLWGKTVGNKVATWRSGLGLSADGRYLIYAAGDGLTVPALAQALAAAGADRGMQLDINSWWTRFVTFAPVAGGHVVAQKLLADMAGDARQFLAPDIRDFFYVTVR